MHAGMPQAQLVRDGGLVSRVAEREEQADGDSLCVADVRQGREIERLELAVGAEAPLHAVAALERHERLGLRRAQPIQMRTRLASQVQQVLEAGVADEGRACAAPLEQRVRRDRGAVSEAFDIECGALDMGRAHGAGGREHRFLLPRSGRNLGGANGPAVEEHRVGERSAHVDAQDRHARTLHRLEACCNHLGMPPLGAKERAQLPDSAFAYIDSTGRRRLPINDPAHVRNALARFSQVAFEDESARDRARTRLLRAARKHGIVPIGFISAQLQPQRKLPKGHVTFLLTDLEGSTELLGRLDELYPPLLADVRRLVRAAVRRAGGREVDARADDLFAVFESAPAALEAALAIQRAMHEGAWPGGVDVRLRIGLHRGRPTLTDTGYVGLAVHSAARIAYSAHGGQIVASSAVHAAVVESLSDGVSLKTLGAWRFQGLPEPVDLFQVAAADLPANFPPPRSAAAAE